MASVYRLGDRTYSSREEARADLGARNRARIEARRKFRRENPGVPTSGWNEKGYRLNPNRNPITGKMFGSDYKSTGKWAPYRAGRPAPHIREYHMPTSGWGALLQNPAAYRATHAARGGGQSGASPGPYGGGAHARRHRQRANITIPAMSPRIQSVLRGYYDPGSDPSRHGRGLERSLRCQRGSSPRRRSARVLRPQRPGRPRGPGRPSGTDPRLDLP